jgi:hypothetical protein
VNALLQAACRLPEIGELLFQVTYFPGQAVKLFLRF